MCVDDGWVTAREAAAALGVDPKHIAWLSRRGQLVSERRARGWFWVRRDSLDALVAERASWVSWTEATAIVGCPRSRLERAVRDGTVDSRPQAWRTLPSVRRFSLEALIAVYAQEQRAAEERRTRRPATAPPDDELVWLTMAEVALLLQITRPGVRYRVEQDLIPHVRIGRRVWFRRDHVEQVAAARAFRMRQTSTPS